MPATPFTDERWAQLAREALVDLGGDSLMVVGAKLRQKMAQLGHGCGLDVAAYLAAADRSFLTLIDGVPDVVVRRRQGSDALIGTVGAEEPEWRPKANVRRGALRRDVYQAFTRVAPMPFVYLPQTDRFVSAELAQGPTIEVPTVTIDILIGDRRKFVDSLPESERPTLLAVLEHTASPLVEFRRTVEGAGILDKWGTEQARIIWSRIEEWTKAHDLVPREAWFEKHQTADSAHRVLSRLAPYLTPGEIRQLQIPFRAIEALLSDLQRR